MTWSDDPTRLCHHHAEVLVDAPLDVCYGLWADWKKIIDFMDLVQQARAPPRRARPCKSEELPAPPTPLFCCLAPADRA